MLVCETGIPWDLWVAPHRQEQQEDTGPSFCLEDTDTAHTSALFARGSSCLQPVLETLSCLACLQVAGQDAEARRPGLEWPGRMLEAICDPQLGAEMLLVLEASDPSESVPAVLSSGHNMSLGTETRKINGVQSHSPWTLPTRAPTGPSQSLLRWADGCRAGRVLASTPTGTGLALPPLAKIPGMGESSPMGCLHLHQAGLRVGS